MSRQKAIGSASGAPKPQPDNESQRSPAPQPARRAGRRSPRTPGNDPSALKSGIGPLTPSLSTVSRGENHRSAGAGEVQERNARSKRSLPQEMERSGAVPSSRRMDTTRREHAVKVFGAGGAGCNAVEHMVRQRAAQNEFGEV